MHSPAQTTSLSSAPAVDTARVEEAITLLRSWIEARDYAGYEPYDLLNSPLLQRPWCRRLPFSYLFIQLGKRYGGMRLRRWLRVPPSKNPKALGLILAAYCDLARVGCDSRRQAAYLRSELERLRSPGQAEFCWGYDWDYVALRGPKLPAFQPNAIATTFCAQALLDASEVFADSRAAAMAESAGEFIARRLPRSVDSDDHLCFGYTLQDHMRIYNSSALAAAFLSRLAKRRRDDDLLRLARRAMNYLSSQQRGDGSWAYGAGPTQRWVDGFHTGYNLSALLQYRAASGDHSFNGTIDRGYRFYKSSFFRQDGAPKYLSHSLYPIDIHSCSQAMLTFCDFAVEDTQARSLAMNVFRWTIANMRAGDGSFYYQRHRWRTDRAPYMRWGQAWMLRAIVRLNCVAGQEAVKEPLR